MQGCHVGNLEASVVVAAPPPAAGEASVEVVVVVVVEVGPAGTRPRPGTKSGTQPSPPPRRKPARNTHK